MFPSKLPQIRSDCRIGEMFVCLHLCRSALHDVGGHGYQWRAIGRLLAVVVCGVFAGGAVLANPTGSTVAHGTAQFARPDATTLDITASSNAIINWQGFSVGAGETTRFIQPTASSAVLNRVTGSDASTILGRLLSNGRVFLVNPNGIVFGEDAVVDTAGLVASTLGIDDADFLAGRYEFDAGPDAGDIENLGLIESGAEGVFLLAPSVENSGVIRTDGGDLVLAAGRTITLTSFALGGVQVEVQAPDDEVLNLGELIANRGAAGVFADSIRNTGTVEANAVTVDEDGTIRLVAENDLTLEAGGRVTAEGPSGGEIHIESKSGTTWVSGEVSARGSEGTGGTIRLLGPQVGLERAAVDASGPAGGGEVLVGGDESGEGTVPTADSTYVSADSIVSADALEDGNGGKVVVFAEGFASVLGGLSARGGPDGGDGGFVETSGLEKFVIASTPDITAPNGDGGEWLVDPNDIEIVPGRGAVNVNDTDPFTSTDDSARLGIDLIIAALSGGQTVRVQTTESGGSGERGDITLNAPLDIEETTGTNTLILESHHDIIINEAISDAAGGAVLNLVLDTDWIGIGADVTLLGGSLRTAATGDDIVIANSATVTLDGDGVYWDIDNRSLAIGADTGTESLSNDGTVVLRNGATINEAENLVIHVGFNTGSEGTLRIESGADVTAHKVFIGNGSGSRGTVTVTGSDSSLTTVGDNNEVFVGNRGTGTIHVLDGGLVDTRKFHLAWWGVGGAVIRGVAADGTRSRVIVWPANGVDPDFPDEGGFARVARNAGSNGRLEILEGGLLRVLDTEDTFGPFFHLARDKRSVGTLLIDGEGSSLEVIQNGPAGDYGPSAALGRRGRGTTTIRNGGRLLVQGERASIDVSRDSFNPDFPDADTGPIDERSEVGILSGGKLEVAGEQSSFIIGNGGPAADGVVTIDGQGSALVLSGTGNRLIVGDDGSRGSLEERNGGTVRYGELVVGAAGTTNVSASEEETPEERPPAQDPPPEAPELIEAITDDILAEQDQATVIDEAFETDQGDTRREDEEDETDEVDEESGEAAAVDDRGAEEPEEQEELPMCPA